MGKAIAETPAIAEPGAGRKAAGQRGFEVIYEAVRRDLTAGSLKPGDKLPAERELAEQLGFSRAAVREAIRALEANGIVRLLKGASGGAFVRAADPEAVTRSIADLMVLEQIPLRQVMEVRTLLLTRAVELMCQRCTTEELDLIERNIAETEQARGDMRKVRKCVAEFYNLIGRLSGNAILEILIQSMTAIAIDLIIKHKIEFSDELVTYRRNVLSRLRARDAEGAVRAMAENMAFLHGFVIARAARP